MVTWTADKDAQLLVGIFEFTQIPTSQALLKHLAEKIGEGCTPKAVSHRLNNIKKTGKPTATPNSTPSKPSAATPKSPNSNGVTKSGGTGTGTGRARGRPVGSGKKKDAHSGLEGPGQDMGSDDEYGKSPTSGKGKGKGMKRGRGDEEDDEVEEMKKRIKIKEEAVDEEYGGGYGLEYDDEGLDAGI